MKTATHLASQSIAPDCTLPKQFALSLLRRLAGAFLALLVAVALPASASAQGTGPFTPEQEKRIRALVRDYIIANPEIIVEAMQRLRAKQEEQKRQQIAKALVANRKALTRDPDDPVGGNPKGDVTIVEFFDYRCPYCKAVYPRMIEAAKADGKVRIVFKEFPILGEVSVYAAKAALASQKQGKYVAYHHAMMSAPGQLTKQKVLVIAKSVGIDTKKLERDMEDPKIRKTIAKAFALAQALKINGTPAFVIGDTLVPGAVDTDRLTTLIKEARKSAKR